MAEVDKFYGIREICNVTLRAKRTQKFGTLTFQKDAPVLYFLHLKTTSLEGAASTVYAQGGRGNPRLIAWEGEKTLTITFEDALLSPRSLSVLSGAGFTEEDANNSIYVHVTESTEISKSAEATDYWELSLENSPSQTQESDSIYTYIMPLDDNGDIIGSPIRVDVIKSTDGTDNSESPTVDSTLTTIKINTDGTGISSDDLMDGQGVLVDYYTQRKVSSQVKQLEITADQFAGYYYLEADCLFRDQSGTDYAAEIIIPNCKVQSNFTLTMASSGDPSTFTFVLDAFPGYLKWDKSKKVLAAIQIIEDGTDDDSDVMNYNGSAEASSVSSGSADHSKGMTGGHTADTSSSSRRIKIDKN